MSVPGALDPRLEVRDRGDDVGLLLLLHHGQGDDLLRHLHGLPALLGHAQRLQAVLLRHLLRQHLLMLAHLQLVIHLTFNHMYYQV